MSDLYDADFLIWSEAQADLLRRMARGERVNGVDWDNLIEEVESLGRSEFNAVRSLLEEALVHRLKAVAWPRSDAVPGWLDEGAAFLARAARQWTPSMARRIDLAQLYADAASRVRTLRYREGPPEPLPAQCPATLGELLEHDPDLLDLRFKTGSETG